MGDFGTVTEKGTIRFERLLPGPVERVWSYLTESDKRAKWLGAGPMELTSGGAFELIWRNAELSPRKENIPEKYRRYEPEVRMSGRITRCEPPRLLSHTWEGGDSEVTYELTPRGASVLLVLTHRRIASRKDMMSFGPGWHTHLDILEERLNDREPAPFWSAFDRRQAEYENRLPKESKG
jgi:uncharacterized protein YndB with AHSA1/START domain